MESIRVAIIMGSDSDLPTMVEAGKVLEQFGIDYEYKIASAHRTPDAVADYARSAFGRGLEVIIAGAGGAAHLPGVIAAHTTLPVIGVPLVFGALQGVDALYSMAQMPPGIPVATMGINGARNAALLAVEILALKDEKLRLKIEEYRKEMAQAVLEKDNLLRQVGVTNYLQSKGDNK